MLHRRKPKTQEEPVLVGSPHQDANFIKRAAPVPKQRLPSARGGSPVPTRPVPKTTGVAVPHVNYCQDAACDVESSTAAQDLPFCHSGLKTKQTKAVEEVGSSQA
ncbi:hypothetical protein HYH03_004639 [Edaphochlamys debaryana]|uniref:Uncharacterized protein n=1 Tax=Edaphochlamys debaryana TaxID=47281 RepID=A0A836C203_9CHLO|nr:hypothetical protein HYH03_004639 [Edaphochlamys debaryana]|eukprot:KAG2497486.1 hypothetical protein HYH03_004639 [Edaphochlamys debaryana]